MGWYTHAEGSNELVKRDDPAGPDESMSPWVRSETFDVMHPDENGVLRGFKVFVSRQTHDTNRVYDLMADNENTAFEVINRVLFFFGAPFIKRAEVEKPKVETGGRTVETMREAGRRIAFHLDSIGILLSAEDRVEYHTRLALADVFSSNTPWRQTAAVIATLNKEPR